MKSIGYSGLALGEGVGMVPGVPSSPHQRLRADWRSVLRAALKNHPTFRGSMRQASLAAGLNHSAISEWLRDTAGAKQKQPSFEALAAVAHILSISLDNFLDVSHNTATNGNAVLPASTVKTTPVVGVIQAGVWQEPAMLDLEDRTVIPYIPDPRYADLPQYAWRVTGHSLNRIADDGEYIITVRFVDLGREPKDGEPIVCERRRHGTYEYTVKRVRFSPDGRIQLVPDSTDPRHQTPIWLNHDESADAEVEATHLLVGVYRPL
jgi:phage repressor protein C with HTH and peptisase S24 domain